MAEIKRNSSGSAFRRTPTTSDKVAVVRFDRDSPAKLTSETIVRHAYDCLECHPHFRGRTFAIEVRYVESESVLHLEGSLPSFFLMQMLQSALRDLDGVAEIQNNVEVLNPADPLIEIAGFDYEREKDEQEKEQV